MQDLDKSAADFTAALKQFVAEEGVQTKDQAGDAAEKLGQFAEQLLRGEPVTNPTVSRLLEAAILLEEIQEALTREESIQSFISAVNDGGIYDNVLVAAGLF